jgi:hypothetical protein
MARGSSQATTAASTAQNLSDVAGANAGQVYGQLAPELSAEAAHPAGFDPATEAAMNTSAQQSAGGSEAAAVGQGALKAARTRNVGGSDAAIASGTRAASDSLSKRALDIQSQNAQLKNHQQQEGITGLEGLYGTDLGEAGSSLGQVAGNVNANTNAENASYDWMKDLVGPLLGAGTSAYGAYTRAQGQGGG